jgi:hypothetical protein
MTCRNCQGGWYSIDPCSCIKIGKAEFFPYPQVGWPLSPSPGDLPPMPTAPGRFPHKCPVCEGKGTVNEDHINSGGTIKVNITCHACKGEGIVWG